VASSQADKEIEILHELKRAFGPRFISIAEEYRTSLPGKLAAMRDAGSLGAYEILAASAHRLAGGSASLGALEVSALCRQLETECSDGEVPPNWEQQVDRIADACAIFSERLRAN
jgi:HPt (histidine-containing phosphotransfer) domain-containing protein